MKARRYGWMAVVLSTLALSGCSSTTPLPYKQVDKPYVVLRRGDIRAIVVNNEPVDDDILPRHRGGYSGLASLTHTNRSENVFVPFYAGLNFEHIHDGTAQHEDILFEPRRAPMEIRRIDDFTVELYQPPTPHWKLESRLQYELLADGVIELRFECVPHERTFKNGYIGLFFAGYIDKPDSIDIHFLGFPAGEEDCKIRPVTGVTPAHGKLSTHIGRYDNRKFPHDSDFPLTLVFNFSKYFFAEPWYYGISGDMALVFVFRQAEQVRFSQSPSGGGSGHPAWDFQWYIPDYQLGRRYTFVMRLMYLPFESPEQITAAVASHITALNSR